MKTLLRLRNKLLHPALVAYWYIFRPKTFGAKVILEHQGCILFVRHTYGSNAWRLPGGGMKKGEAPYAAAVREVFEELGLALEQLETLGTIENSAEYKRDTVHCFLGRAPSEVIFPDPTEIALARWFPKQGLPEKLSPTTSRLVALYKDFLARKTD